MNGFNAMWSSYNCTDTNFYICKVPPKASDTHCPQGTAQGLNANDCYEYDGGRFSWVNAAAYCEDHGGNLATITSAFQSSAFNQLPNLMCTDFEVATNTYWLGGVYSARTPYRWVWNDGKPMSFTKWAKGQPANSQRQCLMLDPTTGTWLSNGCDTQQFYVCKLPPVEHKPVPTAPPAVGQRCPDAYGYVAEVKKCIYIEWTKYQWNDALLNCYSKGGVLASFHDQAGSDAVWNYMSQTMFDNKQSGRIVFSDYIHIGLYDPNHSGSWQWLDGTPLKWTNWDVGHPCCGFCACAWFQQGWPFNGIWHGLSCDTDPNPHPSICEAEPY
ncbi:Macrophage mannose receptor 1 [Aphelenchoides avenae]|nr:Macrophage mannose receptor 1 [Aphelenchus avenae]